MAKERAIDERRIADLERNVTRIDTRETSCEKNVTARLDQFDRKLDRIFETFDGFRTEFFHYREQRAVQNGNSRVEQLKTDAEQARDIAWLKARFMLVGAGGTGGMVVLVELIKSLLR